MRPELEELQQLEKLLQGKLSEAQEQDLEIQLLWDLGLQQRVANQQVAYQAVREAGRQQLRQELKAIHTKLFG